MTSPKRKRGHRQIPVQHGDLGAAVDEKLAPVILACWKRGISTLNCCEGGPAEDAYIQFASHADAALFLKAACTRSRGPDSLYFRAVGALTDVPHRRSGYRVWLFDADAEDVSPDDEAPSFSFRITVRFPRADIPRLMRALGA